MVVKQDRGLDEIVKYGFAGSGVTTKNARFSGMAAALGEFAYPNAHSFFTSGIVLSTGKATDMAAANTNPKTSTVNGSSGDKNLNYLAGGRTFDAASLDFDFVPEKDSVTFNFIFASEEYNDYVGSTFNDAFFLLITGPGMPAGKNLAYLPGTTTPITVNSINATQNRQYYVDNNPFTLVGKINETVKAKLDPEILQNFSFDGMTKVFSVGCRLAPKQQYHFQLAIADAGDGTVDSAVLLEGSSLQSVEQYKHVFRRMQIAEKHRQDSLARVKVIQDSINTATELRMLREKVRQDSMLQVQRHFDDSLNSLQLRNQTMLPDSVIPQDLDGSDDDEEEESDDFGVDFGGETKADERPKKVEIQDLILYDGESYLLSPAFEGKIQNYGKMLAGNPKLKLGIYLPENDSHDVINMRFDVIRIELIKAGAKSNQVFRNGFSHSVTTNVHRAEIWIREE